MLPPSGINVYFVVGCLREIQDVAQGNRLPEEVSICVVELGLVHPYRHIGLHVMSVCASSATSRMGLASWGP